MASVLLLDHVIHACIYTSVVILVGGDPDNHGEELSFNQNIDLTQLCKQIADN